jgi:uncharacterized protein (TIGR02996 family)
MPPTFPHPAATLPGEADLLAAVVADLSDDTAKLVYADWLDERDDPRGPLLRAFVAAFRSGGPLPPSGAHPKPWRDVVGVTLVEAARTHGFADRIDRFFGLARPALTMQPAKRSAPRLPVGVSRYGGRPDLPSDVTWPVRGDGKPHAFLGQINFADLAGSVAARTVPAAGVLSVFYDLYDEEVDGVDNFPGSEPDCWRLFHFPPAAGLEPRDYPVELRPVSRFEPHPLAFGERLELPRDAETWRGALGLHEAEVGGKYAYDFLEAVQGWDRCDDRLFGYPESEFTYGGLGRAGRNLVMIKLTGSPGLWDNHIAILHFTIADDDLRAGRLDRVRAESEYVGT